MADSPQEATPSEVVKPDAPPATSEPAADAPVSTPAPAAAQPAAPAATPAAAPATAAPAASSGWGGWWSAATQMLAPISAAFEPPPESAPEATPAAAPAHAEGEAPAPAAADGGANTGFTGGFLMRALEQGFGYIESGAEYVGTQIKENVNVGAVGATAKEMATRITQEAKKVQVGDALSAVGSSVSTALGDAVGTGLGALEVIGMGAMSVLTEQVGPDERPFYRPRTFGKNMDVDDATLTKILENARQRNAARAAGTPSTAAADAPGGATSTADGDAAAAASGAPAASTEGGAAAKTTDEEPPELTFDISFKEATGPAFVRSLEKLSVECASKTQKKLMDFSSDKRSEVEDVVESVSDLFFFDEDATTEEAAAGLPTSHPAGVTEEVHQQVQALVELTKRAKEEGLKVAADRKAEMDAAGEDLAAKVQIARRGMLLLKNACIRTTAELSAKSVSELLQVGSCLASSEAEASTSTVEAEGEAAAMASTQEDAVEASKYIRQVALCLSNDLSNTSIVFYNAVQGLATHALQTIDKTTENGMIVEGTATQAMTDIYCEASHGTSFIFDGVQFLEPVIKWRAVKRISQ